MGMRFRKDRERQDRVNMDNMVGTKGTKIISIRIRDSSMVSISKNNNLVRITDRHTDRIKDISKTISRTIKDKDKFHRIRLRHMAQTIDNSYSSSSSHIVQTE